MSLKGLTLKKSDVSQTINLEELFGVSFRGERELRLAIAQKIIDHIKERTESGKTVSGGSFAPYSKEYKNTTIYSLLKSGNTPDLTLTGNMLASMDVLGEGPNTVRIGFGDELERLKAFNHNTGDTVPKRPFFGVSKDEAKRVVLDEFGEEIDRLKGKSSGLTIADLMEQGKLLGAYDQAKALSIAFNTMDDLDEI